MPTQQPLEISGDSEIRLNFRVLFTRVLIDFRINIKLKNHLTPDVRT